MGPSGTSVLIQLSSGSHGGHFHEEWGSFQINSSGEQLAVEHSGYDETFADGSNSEGTSANNGILYDGNGQPPADYILGSPQVLAVESTPTFSYAAVNLTASYQSANPTDQPGNADAGYTVREFLYIKPLNTLFIIDRLQATSANSTESFLLHTPGVPQIVDSNDVTFTSGNQELFLTTLPTTSSHSYSIVDEGDQTATTDIYRLQDNFTTGSATNILLHAITIGSAGSSDAVSVAISGETATTWTITFSSATGGTATLVLNSGIFSLGGSFGYAASGTPVLSPLSNAIETIAVTSGGPVWGSSGSSEAALAMGVLSVAADSASSNDGTTSSQTTTTNSSSTLFGAGERDARSGRRLSEHQEEPHCEQNPGQRQGSHSHLTGESSRFA